MVNQVRCFEVNNINKVDTTRYKNGDLFYTNRSVGILINGKIKIVPFNLPNMKNYVKKDEVQKMIDEALKG